MKTPFSNITIFVALVFAGALLNPRDAKAHSPRARELCGVIQAIDPQTHTLTIQSPKRDRPATFVVKRYTEFIKDRQFTNSASLKEGALACVYYHSPFFGKSFVTKVVLEKQN